MGFVLVRAEPVAMVVAVMGEVVINVVAVCDDTIGVEVFGKVIMEVDVLLVVVRVAAIVVAVEVMATLVEDD